MSDSERELTHLDTRGRARMVDVGDKPVTHRQARAHGHVSMSREALQKVCDGSLTKGDVAAVARIAGIQAAKRTAELIPLCHLVALDEVAVDVRVDREHQRIEIESRVVCRASTGVEMEALVAVSIAAATVYDMCKAVDRTMRIGGIELLEKTGGRSGSYRKRPPGDPVD